MRPHPALVVLPLLLASLAHLAPGPVPPAPPATAEGDARTRHPAFADLRTDAPACSGEVPVQPTATASRAELCELLERARATHTDQLLVLQDGEPLVEWADPDAPERIHVMSVTKSVVALAFGRLLLDGELETLHLPLHRLFPEWRQGRKKDITLWHLLTHTSGLQNVPNAGAEIEPAPDMVQLALAAELTADPGTEFAYNNKAVNLLGAAVEKLSGRPLDTYLETTVFREVGITGYDWIRDPAGNPVSMAGLGLSARDLARLGRLVLQGGRWDGRTVLDPDFVAEATRSQHDLYPRHGLLWWLLPDGAGVYGDGWLGQWLVVRPGAGLVAVRLIDRDSWQDESDSFQDFRETIAALAREEERP